MAEILNKDEIEELMPFRFAAVEKESEFSIRLNELFNESSLITYLEKIGPSIGSPNIKVTASIFVKWYAFLPVIVLYAMTVWNKKVNLSFHQISLQTEEVNNWLPTFYFHDKDAEAVCADREIWRETVLKDIFSNHVHRLILQIAQDTKQSKLILWENISIYLFWLYESVLLKSDDKEIQKRAKEDFYYLVQEAPGYLFGNERENPVRKFFENKKIVDKNQEELRMRTTCCLFYMLKGSPKCCNTCPKKGRS